MNTIQQIVMFFICTHAIYPASLLRYSRRCAQHGLSSKPFESLASQSGIRSDYDKLPRLFFGSPPSEYQSWLKPKPTTTAKLSTFGKDKMLPLSSDQSHYLTTVMRLKNKQSIRIFDGTEEWLADLNILAEDKRRRNFEVAVTCRTLLRSIIDSHYSTQPQPLLCVAPPKKKDRLRWLVEKSTELNVGGFVWLDTEFSQSVNLRNEKLHSYATEATEQSERLNVPTFLTLDSKEGNEVCNVNDFWSEWSENRHVLILACRERSNSRMLTNVLRENKMQRATALLVGPEGGWSEDEEQQMNELEDRFPESFINISLGPNVLRCETAAMAALAAYSMCVSSNPGQ
jgi:16S rRNA (uracil1498-N3)-methyltransferase